MKNLAGDSQADDYIKNELERAGIEVVSADKSKSDVPYTCEGILYGKDLVSGFDISFHRNWCYWVAKGRVPLEIAKKLYAHPEGKRNVRVSGHCGCPPPEEPWINWIDNEGLILGKLSEWEAYSEGSIMWEIMWEQVDRTTMKSKSGKFRWVEDPTKEGTPYITSYHIDSQAGLLLFVEVLKGNMNIS